MLPELHDILMQFSDEDTVGAVPFEALLESRFRFAHRVTQHTALAVAVVAVVAATYVEVAGILGIFPSLAFRHVNRFAHTSPPFSNSGLSYLLPITS